MTRAAPPWERKNGRQMKQARERSQTRLSLQIFRPNLNETFFLVVLINRPLALRGHVTNASLKQ